jgi:hypothetical protein
MCFAPHLVDLPTDWFEVTLIHLSEVEELLDWLERGGCDDMELRVRGHSRFAVRWQWSPEFAEDYQARRAAMEAAVVPVNTP